MNKKFLSILALTCLTCMISGCNDSNSKSSKEKLEQKEILHVSEILLAKNETYNLFAMRNDEFSIDDIILDEELNASEVCYADPLDGNLYGLKIGEATYRVKTAKYYQDIRVKVAEDDYVNSHFVVDRGRLYGKNAVFFGDSITSTGTRPAYPDNPSLNQNYLGDWGYYPDLITEWANLDYSVNKACSGAIVGWNDQIAGVAYPTYAVGCGQVDAVITEMVNFDYAFIFLGTNDFQYYTPVGTIDDMPTSVTEARTYLGGLNYMYSKILAAKPSIRIVAIGIAYSTWGQVDDFKKPANPTDYLTTRPEYTAQFKRIVDKYGFIMIPTWDLWNETNYQTYIPDGIHPGKIGHIRLARRILNEDIDNLEDE